MGNGHQSPRSMVSWAQPADMGPRAVGSTSAAYGAMEMMTEKCQCVPHTVPAPPKQLLLTSLQFSCWQKWVSSALYCSWSSRAQLYWRGLSSLGSMLLASRKRW